MNPSQHTFLRACRVSAAVLVPLLPLAAQDDAELSDAPIDEYRLELLDLAYRSASAFPLVPHLKNRSRAQEQVVEACFELDQPVRALRYADGIADWRRGAAYADYAHYCVAHGRTEGVQEMLERALEVGSQDEQAQLQGWRFDRIRAKVARTHLLLGEPEVAGRVAAGLDPSQAGIVGVAEAAFTDTAAIDAHLESIDAVVESGQFDLVRGALDMCAVYFDRAYEDVERRDALQHKIESSWDGLPLLVRIDLAMELAESAGSHGDAAKAAALVAEAQEQFDSAPWDAEEEIRQRARLARSWFLAGETEKARAMATQALAMYDERREEIQNLFRASVLRPLAEAYVAMGDSTAALVYARAVEEGLENPNARPRADDLVATCVSMARNEFEPGASLWTRLREAHAALGDPW